MRRIVGLLGWKAYLGLGLITLVGAAGWFERGRLLTWYYLHQMERAKDGDVESWVQRLVALDQAAVPGLLPELRRDSKVSAGVARSLEGLMESWGGADSRTAGLVVQTAKEFSSYPTSGKCAALSAIAGAMHSLGDQPSPALTTGLVALLRQAGRDDEASVRGAGLAVAEKGTPALPADFRHVCVELARAELKDSVAENRAHAIRVAVWSTTDLKTEVVRELADPEPEVRCEAILAAGVWEDTVSTEDMLPWLHDPDARVRRACEHSLRDSRNLKDDQLEMGRLVTDARASVRVRVLRLLAESTDLDPNVWLRRLSHDSSPAVRAATLRAVTEQRYVDLADRLIEMAQSDPSPTVRQLAQFYIAVVRQN
jgi:hypothetical protein